MELHGICLVIHYWQKGEVILSGEKKSWKKAPTMKTESTHTRGNTIVQ